MSSSWFEEGDNWWLALTILSAAFVLTLIFIYVPAILKRLEKPILYNHPKNNGTIQWLTHEGRGEWYGQEKPDKLKHCPDPGLPDNSGILMSYMALFHVTIYFVLGFCCPLLSGYLILIGLGWEMMEGIGFRCHNVLDIFWNTLGLLIGSGLRTVLCIPATSII